MNITEKVKSFEDACSILEIENNLPDVTMLPEKHKKSIIAHYKLTIIIEALNEGWVFITQLPSTIDRTLFDFQHGDSICRPKSLSGIENNRGWTRIESEEDLPKKETAYWAYNDKTNHTMYCGYDFELGFRFSLGHTFKATHYQPIEKPKPPIF